MNPQDYLDDDCTAGGYDHEGFSFPNSCLWCDVELDDKELYIMRLLHLHLLKMSDEQKEAIIKTLREQLLK